MTQAAHGMGRRRRDRLPLTAAARRAGSLRKRSVGIPPEKERRPRNDVSHSNVVSGIVVADHARPDDGAP